MATNHQMHPLTYDGITLGVVVPDPVPRVEIGGPGWRIAEPARLHPADLEAIARRVAELLRAP